MLKVLMVEDNPMVQRSVGRLLKSLGYAYDVVDAEAAAVAVLMTVRYDVVLTDFDLGDGGTGRGVLVACARGGVPAVLMSSNPPRDLGSDHLTLDKPFRSAELAQVLEKAIEGKREKVASKPTPGGSDAPVYPATLTGGSGRR